MINGRPLQPENADEPIDVMLHEMFNVVMFVQFVNALLPIEITLPDITRVLI